MGGARPRARLRRLGRVRSAAADRHDDRRAGDELEIELRSVDTVARWIAGHGPDAAVLDPPELATAVRRPGRATRGGATPRTPRPRWRDDRPSASRRGWPTGCRGCSRSCPTCWRGPGVPLAEAAADFGVTERQLRRDLELLWMCGLPGYGPGDLVDLSFEGDTVTVTEDAGLRRPLRLTTAEAAALLVALRTLGDLPGDRRHRRRPAGHREDRAGGRRRAGGAVVAVEVTPQEEATRPWSATALEDGRALRSATTPPGATRDRAHRRPDAAAARRGPRLPGGVVPAGEAVRLFRLDRVDDVAVLDEPAAPPPEATPTDLSAGVFPARPEHGSAVLLLSRGRRWVAEYYPVEEVVELPPDTAGLAGDGDVPAEPGRARVLLRYATRPGSAAGAGAGRRRAHPRAARARRGGGAAGSRGAGRGDHRTSAERVARPGTASTSARARRPRRGRGWVENDRGDRALVAFAVVMAIVLVLAVRPPARRCTRVATAARADVAVRLDRLRALRRPHAMVVEAPSRGSRSSRPPQARRHDLPHWGARTTSPSGRAP